MTTTTTTTTESPRIYVASLSDYNTGRLIGRWIDLDGKDADDIGAAIAEMLAEDAVIGAEEWAIHDYEGFGPLRLSELESSARLAGIVAGCEAADEPAAWLAWLADDSTRDPADPDTLDAFSDAYMGHYDSAKDWAEEYADDIGLTKAIDDLAAAHGMIVQRVTFDAAGYVYDCRCSGEIWFEDAPDGGVYVFQSY